jgi:hypothetical protein
METALIIPIVLSARTVLSGLFLVSGVGKLTHFGAFADAVDAYEIGPSSLRSAVSLVVPPLEVGLGLLWLTGLTHLVFLASLIALAGFTTAMVVNLVRGKREIRCGCGLLNDGHLGLGPVVRNVLTVGAMLIPLLAPSGAWVAIQMMFAPGTAWATASEWCLALSSGLVIVFVIFAVSSWIGAQEQWRRLVPLLKGVVTDA